jgi:protein-tyrosine phosphatase
MAPDATQASTIGRMSDLRVLFVCYGNTCRSPLAEGVFRRKLELAGLDDRIEVDSAGTNPPTSGGPPHPLSCWVASQNGIEIGHLRSRRFVPADLEQFDYVVVLDRVNRRDVLANAGGDTERAKVRLLRDGDVADPIFGGEADYERAYDQIDEACDRLLAEVRAYFDEPS